MVDSAKFGGIQAAVVELKDSFIATVDDEVEREQFARPWPYQDVDK